MEKSLLARVNGRNDPLGETTMAVVKILHDEDEDGDDDHKLVALFRAHYNAFQTHINTY